MEETPAKQLVQDSTVFCVICLEPESDPVRPIECQHWACRHCLTEWCKNSSSCPQCRIVVSALIDKAGNNKTPVQPAIQPMPEHYQVYYDEFVQERRRFARAGPPAPDPDYILHPHGPSSNSSSESSSSGIDVESLEGSSSLSSLLSQSSDESSVSDGGRDRSPIRLRSGRR